MMVVEMVVSVGVGVWKGVAVSPVLVGQRLATGLDAPVATETRMDGGRVESGAW